MIEKKKEEEEKKIFRICLVDEKDTQPGNDLLAPCACIGTIKYVHRICLEHWRHHSPLSSDLTTCNICHTAYVMTSPSLLKISWIQYFWFVFLAIVRECFVIAVAFSSTVY